MGISSSVIQKTQILSSLEGLCANKTEAYHWYESQSIPSLGNQTAAQLVKAGKGQLVTMYLGRIKNGGYA